MNPSPSPQPRQEIQREQDVNQVKAMDNDSCMFELSD